MVSVHCQLHWSCAMLVQCDFGGFSLCCTPACAFSLLCSGVLYIHIHHLYNLGFCMPVFRANIYSVLCHHEGGVLWGKPSWPHFVGSEMMMMKKKGHKCERWKDSRRKQRACCCRGSCLWPCQSGGCSSTLGKVAQTELMPALFLRAQQCCWLWGRCGGERSWKRKCLGVAWQQA